MTEIERLITELPDPEAARSFLASIEVRHPRETARLRREMSLLSDVLALASFSPLLATTFLQNPEYISWLGRERKASGVRPKSELLESLARFSLTNSTIDAHTLFARFRRRELLRIFLADVRGLATVSEVTENISNLADAILEHALMLARQNADNSYGHPLERDDRGRTRPAGFCVVSLGKLGSRELNYASDIDLLFIYSADGDTDGTGGRGVVANKEYFAKLSEEVVRLVGRQAGEGAAYRVDMRLRPNGSIGPLATSLEETIRYYMTTARDWERQVLIRSRSSAGDASLYSRFFAEVQHLIYRDDVSPLDAFLAVKNAKQRIDGSIKSTEAFDVKLGRGGIREIEFIAQALQLAYGGRDRWLRVPHTLISLSRLAEHGYIDHRELTGLHDAYTFLRRLEHILQMEHGLQTHSFPDDPSKRSVIAGKMHCDSAEKLSSELERHTRSVSRVFDRVFRDAPDMPGETPDIAGRSIPEDPRPYPAAAEGTCHAPLSAHLNSVLKRASTILPKAEVSSDTTFAEAGTSLIDVVTYEEDFGKRLAALRAEWVSRLALIVKADASGRADINSVKAAQTKLAEASISAALEIARLEVGSKMAVSFVELPIAVLALGKLASGGLDYESDLDLILTFDGNTEILPGLAGVELYSRAAEYMVTALSGVTRHGNLYRVDLRLRPHGKNGTTVTAASTFVDYIRRSAAIWELLAYVKVHGVSGARGLAVRVEGDAVDAVFERASAVDRDDLAAETRRVRLKLQKERAGRGELDIKYGEGGMLDIYFAARFLQLRDGIRDDPQHRSTADTLQKLRDTGSLGERDYRLFADGYDLISSLDHAFRLFYGRSTKLPVANVKVMETLADRMEFGSAEELGERLAIQRMNIRDAFDRVVAIRG